MKLIVSTAHEVVEALPIWGGTFCCVRCGVRGSLEKLFSSEPNDRCTPHFEMETSGWEHDGRFRGDEPRPEQWCAWCLSLLRSEKKP